MKFTGALVAAVCAVPAVLPHQYKVTFDYVYDDARNSVDIVACSGMLKSEGYTTFGSLPGFPYVGGASVIPGYDSSYCGTCWELTYNDNSINILAIDTAAEGFNIATEAFDALTGGQHDPVNATAKLVELSACGEHQGWYDVHDDGVCPIVVLA